MGAVGVDGLLQPPPQRTSGDGGGQIDGRPVAVISIGLRQEKGPFPLGQPLLQAADELGEEPGGRLLQVQNDAAEAAPLADGKNVPDCPAGITLSSRRGGYPHQHQTTLAMGRERGLAKLTSLIQLIGHVGQRKTPSLGLVQGLGRREQELPRGRIHHKKEPPCPLVSVRV